MTLVALLSVAALLALWLVGPREQVDPAIAVDPGSLPDDLDRWLADREALVPDLKQNVHKRILWAGRPGQRTPLSVVYIHGFSASSEEIRPVPDRIAAALGANLHFTRLTGHGQDGRAMAGVTAGALIGDLAEALAVGRRIGTRVLIVATSAGGALAALAATDPALSRDLAGVVLLSPAFRLRRPAARLLSLPWARRWAPLVGGGTLAFAPRNEAHAAFWTTRYPLIAAVALVALTDHVRRLDFGRTEVPALFVFCDGDRVVSAPEIHRVFRDWGGPKAAEILEMQDGDDPEAHVIAGDILSPGQTDRVAQRIISWARDL